MGSEQLTSFKSNDSGVTRTQGDSAIPTPSDHMLLQGRLGDVSCWTAKGQANGPPVRRKREEENKEGSHSLCQDVRCLCFVVIVIIMKHVTVRKITLASVQLSYSNTPLQKERERKRCPNYALLLK